MGEVRAQSVQSLANSIADRAISAVETVQHYLERIEENDQRLQSFREQYHERALDRARQVDRDIEAGRSVGPLAGVPIAVKDNIVTSFGTSAAGSRMLENFRSPYSATAVQRLEEAGAIIIGRTHCDEFGFGSSNEHCAFATTTNPWDTTRVPGGSSGGSAAAVAAGLCPAALGSDTGGSIRLPASFCGVVGLKPSYGRVSRYGLVAFGSSLDQIGPMTTNVADAALLLRIIAGTDANDSTAADRHVPDYLQQLDNPPDNLRIGIPKQVINHNNHPEVNRTIENVAAILQKQGATIIDIDLPLSDYAVDAYYVIAPAEASSNLARYDGIRYGHRAQPQAGESVDDLITRSRTESLGPEAQRRIMLGTFVLSGGYVDAYYNRALKARRLIAQEYAQAFEHCDAILGPTAPAPAFALGERIDPINMYLTDVYTTGASVAGLCALSLPAGYAEVDGSRLPIGVQLQCKSFEEQQLLRIARFTEAALDLPPAPIQLGAVALGG